MISLKRILTKKGYIKINLKKINTNHFELKAKINGVKGRFILDTGASNSCVGFDDAVVFNLETKASKIKAAGAGATDMLTKIASKNKLKIGKWIYHDFSLVLFDLSHVNIALENHGAKAVNGIIGADILEKGDAIIDYKKNRLYLKRLIFKY